MRDVRVESCFTIDARSPELPPLTGEAAPGRLLLPETRFGQWWLDEAFGVPLIHTAKSPSKPFATACSRSPVSAAGAGHQEVDFALSVVGNPGRRIIAEHLDFGASNHGFPYGRAIGSVKQDGLQCHAEPQRRHHIAQPGG
jgi:hypothetical protein